MRSPLPDLVLAGALSLLVPFAGACKSSEASASEPSRGPDGDGVALVELFTSEGCSSCPSADVALGELAAEGNPRVFPLAFHVDYWNSIGWNDAFSSEAWTQRQRDYAASFGTSSVYTPEMVVGGVDAFVGSDRAQARAAIARALAHRPTTQLTLSTDKTDKDKAEGPAVVAVHVHLEPPVAGAVVRVALVERGLSSRVTSGENAGKTLRHENVVRAFVAVPIAGADVTARLLLPPSVDRSHAEVIAFVQPGEPGPHGKGLPVLGAARTPAPLR